MNTSAKTLELTIVKSPVEEINQLHAEMNALAENAVQKALRIGELLSQQKTFCKRGEWQKWLKDNINFAQTSANGYMRIYQARSKLATVASLREALRISVPKDKPARKRKPKLQDDLILHFRGNIRRIEKPLKSWHIIDDRSQKDHQSMVCTTCWVHVNFGTRVLLGGNKKEHDALKANPWIYECKCKDSLRATHDEKESVS